MIGVTSTNRDRFVASVDATAINRPLRQH